MDLEAAEKKIVALEKAEKKIAALGKNPPPYVLGQGPGTLMDPGPLNGQGPGQNLLVCWAKAQGSVGRAPYIGVYHPWTHVGGHRPVDSLRPTV